MPADTGSSNPGETTDTQAPGGSGVGGALPEASGAPAQRPHPEGLPRPADPLARGGTGPSDGELLGLHVAGDPDAFAQLFLRHRDRLWAVAVRTLSNPEDAADALQDAMISAFRRAGTFRGESAVTTWLHRIVVNACLDRMRRRTARPEVSESDEQLLDALAAADPTGDPAARSDTSMEVMAALQRLPHDQQVALILVDMLEYPVADAAQIIGVAEGTVKSRCARGRARLLPRLAHLRNRSGPGSVLPAREAGDEGL